MINLDHKAARRWANMDLTLVPIDDVWTAVAELQAGYLDAIDALREVLHAERISNRPPETVLQAEAKLDAIRKAAKRARAILGET